MNLASHNYSPDPTITNDAIHTNPTKTNVLFNTMVSTMAEMVAVGHMKWAGKMILRERGGTPPSGFQDATTRIWLVGHCWVGDIFQPVILSAAVCCSNISSSHFPLSYKQWRYITPSSLLSPRPGCCNLFPPPCHCYLLPLLLFILIATLIIHLRYQQSIEYRIGPW